MAPFAELGVVMLLFSIGLELSFKRLWAMRRLVFGVGAAELAGAAAILMAGLIALNQASTLGAMGLGLALALSSTALVLPLAGTESPVGRAAFAMLLFEDVALVPIIFVLAALGPTADAGFARVPNGRSPISSGRSGTSAETAAAASTTNPHMARMHPLHPHASTSAASAGSMIICPVVAAPPRAAPAAASASRTRLYAAAATDGSPALASASTRSLAGG